jgi:predicted membrane channel-forming protein YqfA (hemolysin III family)
MKKLLGALGFIASLFILFIKTKNSQQLEPWHMILALVFIAGLCFCVGSHSEENK